MEVNTKEKFRTELRSFFGLTILNLMIGAMMLALGIALAVTTLLGMVDLGQVDLVSVLLVGLGAVGMGAGFYWVLQIAQIMDGVDDIKTAYEELGEGEQEKIAGLVVKMMANYRSNQQTVSRMIVLGKIGGALFMAAGVLGMIGAGASMASEGVVLETISQLVSGVMAFGVGVAGLILSRIFSSYTKVWDARLREAAKIEAALGQKLEGE
jgi:hypothetical protein